MFLQSKEYLGICKALVIMDCGIQKPQNLFSELIQMQIGQEVLMIEKTSGGAFFLGSCLVSWLNKKKNYISLSTTEAEYIVATFYCTQVLWIKTNLKDIQVPYDQHVSIMCDNTSAINLSKNLVQHSKTKHIPIKYHFLREQVQDWVVKLEYVPSKEKIADIFTKPLPRDSFEYFREKLGVLPTLHSNV
jgi:hypothetical protein